jgi:hypothetical protein
VDFEQGLNNAMKRLRAAAVIAEVGTSLHFSDFQRVTTGKLGPRITSEWPTTRPELVHSCTSGDKVHMVASTACELYSHYRAAWFPITRFLSCMVSDHMQCNDTIQGIQGRN